MELEDTFHKGADAVVSKEERETFRQLSVAPLTSDLILMRHAITFIPFHVGVAMTKWELETLTAGHKGVDICLSDVL